MAYRGQSLRQPRHVQVLISFWISTIAAIDPSTRGFQSKVERTSVATGAILSIGEDQRSHREVASSFLDHNTACTSLLDEREEKEKRATMLRSNSRSMAVIILIHGISGPKGVRDMGAVKRMFLEKQKTLFAAFCAFEIVENGTNLQTCFAHERF
jgi:hypothetical protein